MKANKYFLINVLFFIFLCKTKILADEKNEYQEKHLIIVLRDIGHKLLLQSHDSTSRILPVKKVNENLYQIKFESQFAFVTDSLINLVQRRLKNINLPSEYIVSVLDCKKLELIYGYEISNKTGNIMPCTGIKQPKDCYIIQIEFLPEKSKSIDVFFWLLIPFSLVSFYFGKSIFGNKIKKKDNIITESSNSNKFSFMEESGILKINNQEIELFEKEGKLLKILLNNQNQTVNRELLINEIWEKEGVIVVTRSLDVLVSKLRKKLETEPNMKIVNVHGKGYKLVVNQLA
jgi:DNA-binding winged helix-turn-helix (wHTH) protein